MFLENDVCGTFVILNLMAAALIGLGPIAVALVIKMALYNRRVAKQNVRLHRSVKAIGLLAQIPHRTLRVMGKEIMDGANPRLTFPSARQALS